MRQFRLINGNGKSYPLNDVQKVFMHGAKGLGYAFTSSFKKVGTRYRRLSSDLAQGVITAKLNFSGAHAYDNWFEFAQFCLDEPLRLGYKPQDVEYFCDCYVTKHDRSESGGFGLVSQITISMVSPWYKVVFAESSSSAEGGKVYDYTYDYTYADSITQSVFIESDSYLSSPTKITIFGYALNPAWRHYVNSRLVTEGRVIGTIEENRKLVIDTTTGEYEIRQYDLSDNLISDMYQQSDFSTYRFVNLGYGRNTISVSQDGVGDVNMHVEARIEYPTV